MVGINFDGCVGCCWWLQVMGIWLWFVLLVQIWLGLDLGFQFSVTMVGLGFGLVF